MSKVSNMTMAEIFNRVDIKIKLNDISKICSNSEQANRIRELIAAGKDYIEVMIDNEEYIDKEKMLLVTWLNYKADINDKKNKLASVSTKTIGDNKARIEQEIRNINNELLKIKKMCRDVDTYLVVVQLKDGLSTKIKIISSREEILGYDFSEIENSNRKIFDYIDENLLADSGDFGMKYALQTVEFEDFEKVMPYEIAQAIKYKIEHNKIKLGVKFAERFLEREKNGEDTSDLDDEFRQEVLLPEVRDAISQVLRYVDFKKLLLIEIYKIEYELDKNFSNNEEIPNRRLQAAENVASFLLEVIGKDTVLEDGDNTYSYEDALFFLDRINSERNIYIPRQDAINSKNQLLQGLNIEDIEDEDLEKLCMLRYTSEELDSIMNVSQANFTFAMTMQDLSEEQIIQKAHQYSDKWSEEITEHFYSEEKLSIHSILGLYYDGIISAEFFKEFSEENDISSEINLEKIQTLHSQIKKQKDPNEEDIKKLDSMINLYKLINFDDKEDEEKEKIYNEVIEIAEDDEDIVFYFEKGLLTLEIVAEWSGETAIGKLYDEAKITFEDIENLYKTGKISIDLLKSKFETEGLEYSALLSYIDLGYVSEDAIIDLYMKGKIFDLDFEDMFTKGTISIQKYLEATSKRTKEELEKNAKIKFKPTLVNIPNKKIRLETIEDDNDSGYPRWWYIK